MWSCKFSVKGHVRAIVASENSISYLVSKGPLAHGSRSGLNAAVAGLKMFRCWGIYLSPSPCLSLSADFVKSSQSVNTVSLAGCLRARHASIFGHPKTIGSKTWHADTPGTFCLYYPSTWAYELVQSFASSVFTVMSKTGTLVFARGWMNNVCWDPNLTLPVHFVRQCKHGARIAWCLNCHMVGDCRTASLLWVCLR